MDGSWWGENEEEAGLVYFGEGKEGEVIEVSLDDLRVASCGDCRVVADVKVASDDDITARINAVKAADMGAELP